MFSAWNLNTWIASLGAVLFIGSLLTGFAALVTVLMSRVWREDPDLADVPLSSPETKDIRRAA